MDIDLQHSDTFDFNKAVASLRDDYPKETANITFIDSSGPDAAALIEAWYRKSSDVDIFMSEKLDWRDQAEIEAAIHDKLYRHNGAFNEHDPGSGYRALVITPGRMVSEFLDQMPPVVAPRTLLSDILWHEAGHEIIKKASAKTIKQLNFMPPSVHAGHETLAIIFATARGFQTGTLTTAEAESLIAFREAQSPSSPHYDALPALRAFVGKYRPEDIASYSPQQVRKLAERHVEGFMPSQSRFLPQNMIKPVKKRLSAIKARLTP